MTPYIIANPQAGGGRGLKIFNKACQILQASGWGFVPCLTSQAGDIKKLTAQALKAGSKAIVACGGDGTINEIINELKDSDSSLGIIPAGRGNDLARTLNIPLNTQAACEILTQGKKRKIDTISLGNKRFCIVAVLGLAAEVTHLSNQSYKQTGAIPYLLPIKQAIKNYDFPKFKLEHDNGTYEGELTLLAIGNTVYCGGGMRLTPTATPDDGLIDVCIVEKISKFNILTTLPSLFSGNILNKPYVKHFRTKNLTITSPSPLPILADGEFFQNTPAEFSVKPLSLSVIAPAN